MLVVYNGIPSNWSRIRKTRKRKHTHADALTHGQLENTESGNSGNRNGNGMGQLFKNLCCVLYYVLLNRLMLCTLVRALMLPTLVRQWEANGGKL